MAEIRITPEAYEAFLTITAKDVLRASSIQRRTGALLDSVRVRVEEGTEGPEYVLEFLEYGTYLDEGVRGRLGGTTAAGARGLTFQFPGSGLPARYNGRLPYPGYGQGIRPRNWVYDAVTAIIDLASEAFEKELVEEIEDIIVQELERNTNGGQININI